MAHCIHNYYVLYLVYDIANKPFINPISFPISSNGRETISWIRQEELFLITQQHTNVSVIYLIVDVDKAAE